MFPAFSLKIAAQAIIAALSGGSSVPTRRIRDSDVPVQSSIGGKYSLTGLSRSCRLSNTC